MAAWAVPGCPHHAVPSETILHPVGINRHGGHAPAEAARMQYIFRCALRSLAHGIFFPQLAVCDINKALWFGRRLSDVSKE